jgi:anti-sigma B factor antagonist
VGTSGPNGLDVSFGSAAPGTTLIALAGEIDLASVPALTTALDHALRDGDDNVVIDAAQLTFCDASGLGALAVAHTALARRGRRLTVVNATRRLRRSMELLGLGPMVGHQTCGDAAGQ